MSQPGFQQQQTEYCCQQPLEQVQRAILLADLRRRITWLEHRADGGRQPITLEPAKLAFDRVDIDSKPVWPALSLVIADAVNAAAQCLGERPAYKAVTLLQRQPLLLAGRITDQGTSHILPGRGIAGGALANGQLPGLTIAGSRKQHHLLDKWQETGPAGEVRPAGLCAS